MILWKIYSIFESWYVYTCNLIQNKTQIITGTSTIQKNQNSFVKSHQNISIKIFRPHKHKLFLVYIKLNPHEKSQRNIFLWWEGFSIDFLFVLITVQNALVLTWFLCRFNIFLNIIFLMFLLILTKIFFCESYLFKVKDSMFSPFASQHHCKKKK